MILQANLQEKVSNLESQPCSIEKVIELSANTFTPLQNAPLSDFDFIADHTASLYCGQETFQCLLILCEGSEDGILVRPAGYKYARLTAFVPNARSLLTPDMEIDRSYLSAPEPWRNEDLDEIIRLTLYAKRCAGYTLVLPADEEYLSAVKFYLGLDDFSEAKISDVRFKVPYIGELMQTLDCPSVEEYNSFAEALEEIWQQDGKLLTYAAVLDAERPETLHHACELLQNLDNYQRVTDAYDYGQQRLQETLGLDDEGIAELEGYMDFEKYGQDCMEHDGVVITEFGRLRRLEPPFPVQEQGMRM